ncbi:MAG: 4-alpha-glucanotransferase [Clostridia bacterium]|nr:4-alpha-glucanotransferase [Clostridia bacterium]
MNKRKSGVLMHITSLPSRFGIGSFGKEADEFIDLLSDMGFSIWQVLPFHPVDEVNSPYKSESAFAGNPLMICPQELYNDGFITKDELDSCVYDGTPYTADYDFARKTKSYILRNAFYRCTNDEKEKLKDFAEENPWVEDYALFKALKEKNNDAPWWEWQENEKNFAICQKDKEKYRNEMNYYIFVQYLFFKQWSRIKKYALEKGIKILGDMPVYVSMDSADVWSNTELFEIDKDTFVPTEVAGVPPDYFSEDGQLWGNPLYNWVAMEKDGFRWWKNRLTYELKLYDIVRIDHFRGLASYWAVPFESKTAKNGKWKQGPAMKLFNAVKDVYKEGEIIAEDLGLFGEDVIKLLEDTCFPGIRVIQFGFQGGSENEHLPHNYQNNLVACLGTHDNNTLLGWLYELNDDERKYALDYCGFTGDNWGEGGYYAPACRKVIETVWRSCANTAIIAFQDMCGFGNDARMNIPGVPDLNWRVRTTAETLHGIDREYFKKINRIFGRYNEV